MKKKSEKQFRVEGIFPTPIYLSNLKRPYSTEEISFFKKSLKESILNSGGNLVSKDNYVLNNPCLKNLKKNLQEHIKLYFKYVINSNNKVKPYITQSWLNKTEKQQYHHKHKHGNSLISGVLYLDVNEKIDSINFYKDNTQELIQIIPKEYNIFNSSIWNYPVTTGQIVMFPSYLTHGVSVKQHSNIRLSLSFNVFIKGSIGEEIYLTKLYL